MSNSSSRPGERQQRRTAPWILAIVGVLLFGCAGIVAFNTVKNIVASFTQRDATLPAVEAAMWEPDSAVLTVAVSPVT